MEAWSNGRDEQASPSACAHAESSDAPLLQEPRSRAPPFGLLLAVDAAALEEGRSGAPLPAAGAPRGGGGGLPGGRAVAAGTGAVALLGLALLGAAAWSPASFPHRASGLSTRESLDVVGLNVIGVRSTTSLSPTKLPPPAPLRPPPDFAIEPPPGFYPHLPGTAEKHTHAELPAQAPLRPPPESIEPPPGFYPDQLGTAEKHIHNELPTQAPLRPPPELIEPPPGAEKHSHAELPAQAPLRPPPDFAIEPPPGFYPFLPAEGKAVEDATQSEHESPRRSAAQAAPRPVAVPLRPPVGIAPAEGVAIFDRVPAVEERRWVGALAPVLTRPSPAPAPGRSLPATGGLRRR